MSEPLPSKPKVRRYSGNAEGMVRIDQFGGEGGFVASEDYDAALAEIERLRAQLDGLKAALDLALDRGADETVACKHNNQRQGERGPAYCADCGAQINGPL